jgi:myosin protein heavy chain
VDAESKLTIAIKSQTTIEQQLIEVQALLEEETRQKLALSSRLRQADSERESLQNQLEDEEESKRQLEKQISSLNIQLIEVKKKAEEEGEAAIQLDELKKKSIKDIDALQRHIEELQANLDKLDKSRKKLGVSFNLNDSSSSSS